MTDAQGSTVLVTGGTGYLARWVIAGLVQRGHQVRTTVRRLESADSVRAAIGERVGADAAASVEVVAADLLADDGWDAAVEGVGHVIHTASPLGFTPGADLVRTAREGVRRVLGAASRAQVERVVFTSSGVAAVPDDPSEPANETVWAEPSGVATRAYRDSKILAERDAWDLAAETGLELATVLPTFMQGPSLGTPSREGSIEIIRRLLAGGMPAVPNLGWDVVDVRDIAELHILAMTTPAAGGQRLLGSGSFLWWRDIARILRDALGDDARKVPTRTMPDAVVKLLGRVNPQMAMMRPDLSRKTTVDGSKANTLLGWHARPAEQTVIDTATALIARNAI